jgi:chemotaxis protein histidine kinase CheA
MLPLSLESPAYVLFIEEVDKHLHFAHTEFASKTSITAEAAKKLGAAFHTIRGSAGFFGLAEIAELAKGLEERFFALANGTNLDFEKSKESLEKLVALADKLPRAAP